MVHVKVPSIKEDLLTAIQESWDHFDKEFCFKLVESMIDKIKTDIKIQGGTNKYQF